MSKKESDVLSKQISFKKSILKYSKEENKEARWQQWWSLFGDEKEFYLFKKSGLQVLVVVKVVFIVN